MPAFAPIAYQQCATEFRRRISGISKASLPSSLSPPQQRQVQAELEVEVEDAEVAGAAHQQQALERGAVFLAECWEVFSPRRHDPLLRHPRRHRHHRRHRRWRLHCEVLRHSSIE